jgi:hypothetical protein
VNWLSWIGTDRRLYSLRSGVNHEYILLSSTVDAREGALSCTKMWSPLVIILDFVEREKMAGLLRHVNSPNTS